MITKVPRRFLYDSISLVLHKFGYKFSSLVKQKDLEKNQAADGRHFIPYDSQFLQRYVIAYFISWAKKIDYITVPDAL